MMAWNTILELSGVRQAPPGPDRLVVAESSSTPRRVYGPVNFDEVAYLLLYVDESYGPVLSAGRNQTQINSALVSRAHLYKSV